jgi:protein-S-isoprenylcysteine O-methyltransferase Ste14
VRDWPEMTVLNLFAAATGLAGLAVLLYCIWGFSVNGRGTLAPIDPPKVLIVRGLYRYTRNPMYLGNIIVLVSEAFLFRSTGLFIYASIVLLCFHLFIVFYEERHLRSQFGQSYEDYLHSVPRWGISISRSHKRNDMRSD